MKQKIEEQESLPVYLFGGERVVIVEKEEAVEAGVNIIDEDGIHALVSEDDANRLHLEGIPSIDDLDFGYAGCKEITFDCIVNSEYEEHLTYGYVTTEYLASDIAIRELAVFTSWDHQWKSEATVMSDRKADLQNDLISESPEYLEGLENDKIEEIKHHNAVVREQLKELRDEWEKKSIPPPRNPQ